MLIVHPLTVTVDAAAEAPGPPVVVELDTEPPPASTRTDEPPADELLDELPDELLDTLLALPPPELAEAVTLPSGRRSTVAVQGWPVAVLPCLVIVSASAEAAQSPVAIVRQTLAEKRALIAALLTGSGAARLAAPVLTLPALTLARVVAALAAAIARALIGPAEARRAARRGPAGANRRAARPGAGR